MTTEIKRGDENTREAVSMPVADIYETSNDYNLKFELPGVSKENLDITINGDEMEVKADIDRSEPEGKELKYTEYTPNNFYRKFRIGNDIDTNKVNATLEDGILTLVLQKAEEAKPKKIKIN